jgi:hypothetical protein
VSVHALDIGHPQSLGVLIGAAFGLLITLEVMRAH